jgi:uncharacterized protein (DUF849 family)
MTQPCIIAVAITGSLPTKRENPAVPITVAEQIDSTHEAFEAGATLAHLHVRNNDQTPTSDPEQFARLLEGIGKHCPGMILQVCRFLKGMNTVIGVASQPGGTPARAGSRPKTAS